MQPGDRRCADPPAGDLAAFFTPTYTHLGLLPSMGVCQGWPSNRRCSVCADLVLTCRDPGSILHTDIQTPIETAAAVNGPSNGDVSLITCADSIARQHGHRLQYPGLPCIAVLVPALKKSYPRDPSKWYKTFALECCWWVAPVIAVTAILTSCPQKQLPRATTGLCCCITVLLLVCCTTLYNSILRYTVSAVHAA
jgi:hypothetical protein